MELKISQGKKITIENVRYYLPDLLNNAQRRIDEGKYDDAVARLYRAIELIAQIELTHEGLIDEDILSLNKVFKIKKSEIDDLPSCLKYKIKSWHEYKKEPEKHVFKIGSCKNYLILKGLDVYFAKKYLKDDKIRNNVTLRNESILAHGLKRIKCEKAKELYFQVLKYAECVFPNIEEYMDMARFPKFNVNDKKSVLDKEC